MDAAGWDERYSSQELEWGAEPNRFLVPEVEGLSPGRLLDLGAGEGRNVLWLASLGWSATVVDFSKAGIEKGKRIAQERGLELEWVVEDLLTYQPDPGSFDLVLIFYIHIPREDAEVMLQNARSALAPGGTLLIVGHDRANLLEGVGGPQDPTLLYDAAGLAAQLGDLVVEKAEQVLRPVEGSEIAAIDTIVRAHRPA